MSDDYDQEQGGRRGGRIATFLIALVAVVVFAGGIWFAYDRGLQRGSSGGAPPLVKADGSPTKVAPANPGGLQVPNQDMKIYDTLPRGGQAPKAGAEKLLPPPEQPAPSAPRTVAAAPAPAPTAVPAASPVTPPPAGASANNTTSNTVPVAPVPATTAMPPSAPPRATTPTVVAAPPTPAAPAASGSFRIQLAAHRDQAAAEGEWARLHKKFPDILAGLSPTYERADLGERGVFIRVQAGPVRDRVAAQGLCDRLKSAGQGCSIVGK